MTKIGVATENALNFTIWSGVLSEEKQIRIISHYISSD